MGSDPIAIIQKLIAADSFRPFSVQVGDKTFYIEEASHWKSLNSEFEFAPGDIVEIRAMNKLDTCYDYDEYKRAQRAAASDSKEYKKLIRRPEWKEKSQEVFEVRGRECEECGATKYLQVHHRYYVLDGRDPWDYEMGAFIVLCRKCHKARHGLPRCAKTGGSKKNADLAQGELWPEAQSDA